MGQRDPGGLVRAHGRRLRQARPPVPASRQRARDRDLDLVRGLRGRQLWPQSTGHGPRQPGHRRRRERVDRFRRAHHHHPGGIGRSRRTDQRPYRTCGTDHHLPRQPAPGARRRGARDLGGRFARMVTAARARWTNWGGTYSCRPTRIESPTSEEEIVAIVRAAAERGEHVKVIGSGHSFTDIGCTDGCLIKLDRYNKVIGVDRDAASITAQAGVTILELSDALAHFGLAMENMGDVGYQTISGAISTATHGTGEPFRNISSQVVSLSLVPAKGDVLPCPAYTGPQ